MGQAATCFLKEAMPPRKDTEASAAILYFGVEEGQEVLLGETGWDILNVTPGAVLEVCLQGSSISLGPDEWFALLVRESQELEDGIRVGGELLGCESATHCAEITRVLAEGFVHLCREDPCKDQESDDLIHATRVRVWRAANFAAEYVTRSGKGALRRAVEIEERETLPGAKKPASRAPRRKAAAPKAGGAGAKAAAKPGARKKAVAIEVPSGEEGDPDVEAADNTGAAARNSHLRQALRQVRDRVLQGTGAARGKGEGGASGGQPAAPTRSAREETRLVAGTSLRPGVMTPLPLDQSGGSRGDGTTKLIRQLENKNDTSSLLLAQAVQAGERRDKEKKAKKKSSGERGLRKLLDLLQDKKKKKKRRKGRDGKKRDRGAGDSDLEIKPEPGDSGGSSSGSSSSSSSPSRKRRKDKDNSEDDSDLSFEPPLRRKATRDPGSVLEMLIKHAQDQMDRGHFWRERGRRRVRQVGSRWEPTSHS